MRECVPHLVSGVHGTQVTCLQVLLFYIKLQQKTTCKSINEGFLKCKTNRRILPKLQLHITFGAWYSNFRQRNIHSKTYITHFLKFLQSVGIHSTIRHTEHMLCTDIALGNRMKSY